MSNFFSKIFGSNEGVVKKMQPLVDKINGFEKDLEKLSDDELKEKTTEFKERLEKGETLDDLLPEAFATVREAGKRTIGQRHFDVQLVGGIVLHQGSIAEMKTGEGKTLVATLPLYLNALEGKGAHLITVNDYLARFHCAWMGQIYHKLGLTTAVINHEKSYLYTPKKEDSDQDPVSIEYANLQEVSRKDAYAADITYGTNNEFGFDYLRDNMVPTLEQMVQCELNFAIVDEVDSILIDEARTPLIISAPAEESASLYRQFALMVKNLKETDYDLDEKMHSVTLTDEGIDRVEKLLGIEEIYSSENIHLVHHLEEALTAEVLYKKDKNYVVKDGEVIIVDEFTGRLMPGRRYSEGLHQAIEAKENVEVQRESDTLATISFQNLFRMYKKLAGMTGTASTEAEEFWKIYKLDVVEIPTNKPNIRIDSQDQIYKSEDAKFHAVVREVAEKSKKGQPVLIGTISIEKSEKLSKMLKRDGVKHEVLNAKHHEREAKIIEQAGRKGAVTVATNMAGRGVDIILGGAPMDKEKRDEVSKLGGLHIIGTERHESRRIDNQLRGRAGRQGDPGSSLFYVSMEDDLMRIFGGEKMKGMMDRLNLPEDMPIEHGLISRSIESAQKKVEGHNFDIRKSLVEYDDVANKHRQAIYSKRKSILEGADIHSEILEMMDEEAQKEYLEKYNKIGEEVMSQVERMVYLRSIDTMWIEHLNAMDMLREGIGLQGYGQRDPLVEYKARAYGLFQKLNEVIHGQVVDVLLKADIRPVEQKLSIERQPVRPIQLQGASENEASGAFDNVASSIDEEQAQVESAISPQTTVPNGGVQVTVRKKSDNNSTTSSSAFGNVGRNDPCPCGSGKKFKKCHGK